MQADADPDAQEPLGRAYAAILQALDVHESVAVDVAIHIPLGAGLGSSAAMAAAAARAVQTMRELPAVHVERAVAASEAVFHGNASGVDQAAALRGGLLRFRKPDVIRPLTVPGPLTVLGCVAAPGAPTAEMVARVAALVESTPDVASRIFDAIEALTNRAEKALAAGDPETLGGLMNTCHGLLGALGVTTDELDVACRAARQTGAFGAKMTGAGGGGCVIAVAPADAEARVLDVWEARGLPTFAFEIETPQEG